MNKFQYSNEVLLVYMVLVIRQPYLCSKANIQMMYFLNMLSMIMWHKSRSSVMKIQRLLQGVRQGVPEGVS